MSIEWGGHTFPNTEQVGNSTLAMVLGEEFVHHSRTSPWGGQSSSRQRIQSTEEWQLHQPTFQQILTTLSKFNKGLFTAHLNT